MARALPPTLRRVDIGREGGSTDRSVFGSLVRKQGEQRRQAGRVSTLEAYAQLALALGEPRDEVAALDEQLAVFIAALPNAHARGALWDESQTALPARSLTNQYRRRARHLAAELKRGAWGAGGREMLAALLDGQPALSGCLYI